MSNLINSNEVHFRYKEIDNSQLIEYAKNTLPLKGILKYDELESYCYLKIHDDFIFKLFPLIKENNICIPNYFLPKNTIGAHISVVYSNEIRPDKIKGDLKINEINQFFYFDVTGLITLYAFNKQFFALTVSSHQLEKLRIKYGLGNKLNYNGLLVPFHITIAIGA